MNKQILHFLIWRYITMLKKDKHQNYRVIFSVTYLRKYIITIVLDGSNSGTYNH